jgi:hypothetical protein
MFQTTQHEEDKFNNIRIQKEKKNSCLTSCKEKLKTTTKVTNTYTCKTQTKPMHKHKQNTLLYT